MKSPRVLLRCGCVALLAFLLAGRTESAAAPLTGAQREAIDRLARDTLAATGVPSASIAVVCEDRVAYVQAYGDGRLEPRTSAQPSMRYGIGSISKQFTATALLLLAEEGKLSLDEPIAKWLPGLTRARDITLRQLLAHVSGYQDFWPQDYVMPSMRHDVAAEKILEGWARKPLDFEPGAQWQYSNTGYTVAGVIAEKVSGVPLFDFLRQRVFAPLGMRSVMNLDQGPLAASDARGYIRYALGPARPAPKEGKGWLFAAGGLAMTAEDLAQWDIALLQGRVLKPASYRELIKEVPLNDGRPTRYALGLSVGPLHRHAALQHGGEVSGFCTHNLVLPDDHAAVVVLTNRDATSAAATLARKIGALLLGVTPPAPATAAAGNEHHTAPAADAVAEQHRRVLSELQQGRIDRALFTANGNAYFDEQARRDFAESLGPLGEPVEFTPHPPSPRGGLITRTYAVTFKDRRVEIVARIEPDGKIEQYQIAAVE